MKHILFPLSVTTLKQRFFLASAAVVMLATLLYLAGSFMDGPLRSVEFNLAETSPRGAMGGYAVPASGESSGPVQLSYVCDAGGSTITLTIAYTYSSIPPLPSITSVDINNVYYGPLASGDWTSQDNGATRTIYRDFTFPASGTYDVLMTGTRSTGTRGGGFVPLSYSGSVGPIDCQGEGNEPFVDLEVNNDAVGPEWVDGPINIDPTDDLDLRWDSDNVTSCSGSNFTVPNNDVNGTQVYITNPAAGASRTYTIVCTGPDGPANDSVVVNAFGEGGPPILTGVPVYVIRGGQADLEWNTNGNNPASCSLTGPNVSVSPLSAATGSYTVTVYGESTYTLTCPGGVDTATLRVLPVIQET